MAGSAHGGDKIVKPGYHIRPKYDLHGLRHRRTDDHKGNVAGELPLTALIDMFSVLVIYLLMNFSATGEIFFQNKGYPLPKAGMTSPMASAPLISIVGSRFVLEVPPDYDSFTPIEDDSLGLDNIAGALKNFKAVAEQKKLATDNRVNIQAPEDAEIGMIKRAMAASVTVGWTNINFVVDKAAK